MRDRRGWSETTLGEVVGVHRGRSDPQAMPDMPFIGMENVEPHSMKILGTVPAGTMRSSAAHFFPGDVLYGRLRPYLNKVISPAFEGLASAEFIPLTPYPGVEPDFIRFRLNAADFVAFASHLDEGDRPRVDWEGIKPFLIHLPPGPEQRRIVEAIESYLSRLDAAVGSLDGAQAKLKAYRASVLKAAVEGRLVPTEAELARQQKRDYESAKVLLERILKERRRRWEEAELARLKASGRTARDDRWKAKYKEPESPDTRGLPELPEGWCWASVEAISTKVVDGVHKKPNYVESGVPFVTVKNLTAGPGISFGSLNYVSVEDHKQFIRRANPERDDILISKDGTLGVVRRVQTDLAFSIFVSVALIKPVLREVSPFLEVALASPVVQRQMVPKGSGLVHIHLEDLRADVVPLPPMSEQQRIVEVVGGLLSLAEKSEADTRRQLRRVRVLRHAILKWAFEGKLVDQDPSDEPAEMLLERIRASNAAPTPGKKTRGRKARAA